MIYAFSYIYMCIYKCTACWILKLNTSPQIKQNISSSLETPLLLVPHYCHSPKGRHCQNFQKHGSVWPVFVLYVNESQSMYSISGFFYSVLFLLSSYSHRLSFSLLYSIQLCEYTTRGHFKWHFWAFCCSLE